MNFAKLTSSFIKNVYDNKRLLLVFVFLSSIFVSLIFLLLFSSIGASQHAIPGTDYLEVYKPVADSILRGEGIPVEERLGVRYPAGYPVILSIIFGLARFLEINELQLIVVFNIIVAAGATCALFLITESIFNKRIALIASFLWMSYPINLWFLKNPNTEVPFIFLLYISIWLYISALRKRHFGFIFLSGFMLGLAALVRPVVLLLPLFLVLFVFLKLKDNSKRRRFLLAIVLLTGILISILPWEGYILFKTGRVIFLSVGGTLSIVDGLTFTLNERTGADQLVIPGDVVALMKRAKAEDLDTISDIFRFSTRELINEPASFLKLIKIKLVRSWYATSEMWWEGKILIVQLIYLIPGLFGIIYGFRKYQDKIYNITFLLGIILYFWLMTVLVLSILRYMVPVMGFIIIFSAIMVSVIIDRLIKKKILS